MKQTNGRSLAQQKRDMERSAMAPINPLNGIVSATTGDLSTKLMSYQSKSTIYQSTHLIPKITT